MRIALLSAAKSIHTQRWAAALAGRGHTVALFSAAGHGSFDGVETHCLTRGGAAGYAFGGCELKRLLDDFRPDVLNAHYATGYGTLARKCGFHPLLLSVWGSDVYDFPQKSAFHRRIVRKNLENADAVASTSRIMAKRTKKLLRTEKPVYITPFGVDTELFQRRGKPDENAFTVGIVKSLEPKYGVDVLIRAFALFSRRLETENLLPPDGLRLEIVGAGSQFLQLKKLADESNAAGQIVFRGAVNHSQVPQVLGGFDVFCSPSVEDSESFGVSAVEAMACEVPVVASDADGFREVMEDGVTGFLVKKHNSDGLCEKLLTLAGNPGLRARMGRAGRERVKKLYDWNNNVTAMENALAETIRLHQKVK